MSARTARAAASSWALMAVLAGCAPGDDPAAPPAIPDPVAAGDHVPGARVQLSPAGYVAYTRAGDDAEPFVFTARLSDSAGAAIAVPAAGLSWAVQPGRAFRLGAAGVAKDGMAATAQIEPMAGGRDAIVARHGSASDKAFAENWQWLPAAFDWNGGRWTPAGESRCIQVALQTGSVPASLANFTLYAGSFDRRRCGWTRPTWPKAAGPCVCALPRGAPAPRRWPYSGETPQATSTWDGTGSIPSWSLR